MTLTYAWGTISYNFKYGSNFKCNKHIVNTIEREFSHYHIENIMNSINQEVFN